MAREIGSEFHRMPPEHGTGMPFPGTADSALVFSGRTAIAAVLAELPDARTALLPAYCCDSMAEPFRRAGIRVDFYGVSGKDGLRIGLPEHPDADILLWCNYFGFRTPMPDLSGFIRRGGIVIEDITHSLLSEPQAHDQPQYLVASLRKWEPILCGGWCASRVGVLTHKPQTPPPETFTAEKAEAMAMKTRYLERPDEADKPAFLTRFGQSNAWLAGNYEGLAIDGNSADFLRSADIPAQRAARRRNAHRLYERLADRVTFLFPEEDMDCPLFVPVVIPNRRDEVRGALTAQGIYCPIHWPRPKADCDSDLYDTELSLVCDQRCGCGDMDRLADALRALL